MVKSEYDISDFTRARAAFDIARHAAGLALQMKAQPQRVQVAEHFERDGAAARWMPCAKINSRSSVKTVVDRRSAA